MAGHGHDFTFGVGRGQQAASLSFGRGRSMLPNILNYSVDQSVIGPRLAPAASSTPFIPPGPKPAQVISVDTFGVLITDLAKQIGDNISASLSAIHQPSVIQPNSATSQSSSHDGLSHLKVVVQSESKAPPYFRGDHSDTFSVHEWEDMMKCYMNRIKCNTHEEMFDLIMSRLTGRARDVVKVSLRSRPELDVTALPAAVFDILKGNFSELSYSNLPMKDFYSTIPRANESAMDYWIRLNKSIDAADECLRRRGRSVEDPSAEVVMMFINHCPDPSLTMSFQLKAPEQWTASEVQGRLDSYTRNVRRTASESRHTECLSACSQSPVADSFRSSCPGGAQAAFGICQLNPHQTSLPAPVGVCDLPRQDNVLVSQHASNALPSPLAAVSNSAPATIDSSTKEPGVQQLVAMFDKVLSLCSTSFENSQRPGYHQAVSRQPENSQPRNRQAGRPYHQQGSVPTTCRVCSSDTHSTHAHCRLYRLCLNCFGPGHMRLECPQASRSPTTPAPSPSNADLN